MGASKLSEIAVRQAKLRDKTYKLSDGGGMYLEVASPNKFVNQSSAYLMRQACKAWRSF